MFPLLYTDGKLALAFHLLARFEGGKEGRAERGEVCVCGMGSWGVEGGERGGDFKQGQPNDAQHAQ